jgi:hypothetical protein
MTSSSDVVIQKVESDGSWLKGTAALNMTQPLEEGGENQQGPDDTVRS